MANAYSPGLTVSSNTVVQRLRRLPIIGDVLAQKGERVGPETVVARAMLPGLLQSIKAANILGINAEEVEAALLIKVGDSVKQNEIIAQTTSFFGMFKSECRTPVTGVFETFSHANGSVGIRQPPNEVAVFAYISGEVAEVLPGEGVIITTTAALVQGIFGVGGERTGVLKILSASPSETLSIDRIDGSVEGCILVGGASVTAEALSKAVSLGAAGIVVGGVLDRVLADFLGYDIGVAITGHENIGTTLISTEGFGTIPMAERTYHLLQSLEGREASINGATQIRAGVIRPEIVIPLDEPQSTANTGLEASFLTVGTQIRVVREPNFGQLGTVFSLPAELSTVESGALVRVLTVLLKNGEAVTVPRANVEVIDS